MLKTRKHLHHEIERLKALLNEERMKVKSLEEDLQGVDKLRRERDMLASSIPRLELKADALERHQKQLADMLSWERELSKKLALLLARELADDPHNVMGSKNEV